MENRLVLILGLVGALLTACGTRYTPKPAGYFRIELPDHEYVVTDVEKVHFECSQMAQAAPRTTPGEEGWIDITYPQLKATIHCSYKPICGNLRQLSDDANEFVYKHASKASSIPSQAYEDAVKHVYGVLYELRGNTASPYQFVLTDSTRAFFRGAVYFDCAPNQDSLAPVIDYIGEDVRHLMETFEWR